MSNINDISIGQRVHERRVALGLTQEELANLVGYAQRFSIARIEAGQASVPTKKNGRFRRGTTHIRLLLVR